MKRLIPILVFLLAFTAGFGQNWNPLNPGVKRYFTNVYGYLKGVRIDSIAAYGNNIHYYPFKTIRDRTFDGHTVQEYTTGCWIGNVLIKRPGGVFQVVNAWNDTIMINANGQPGDSWPFYQGNNSRSYTAEIISTDTLTILGVTDSIKTLRLSAFMNGVAAPGDSFHNAEIVLSKDHGFHTVMNLFYFPYYPAGFADPVDEYFFSNSLRADSFSGWTSAIPVPGKTAGMYRLTDLVNPANTGLTDWGVGDVLQYSGCIIGPGINMTCSDPEYYALDTIISKIVTTAGVEYVRKGWRAEKSLGGGWSPPYTMAPHADTIFVPDSNFFDDGFMPEDMKYHAIWNEDHKLYYYFADNNDYCITGPAYGVHTYITFIGSFREYALYKNGLGRVGWYSGKVDGSLELQTSNLIYQVKNGVPCGTFILPDTAMPVSVVNINEPKMNVYPNPAIELLTVEASIAGHSLLLVNAVGQVVYRKEACGQKEGIDTRHFADGIYYLRVEQEGKALYNRKIIIQK